LIKIIKKNKRKKKTKQGNIVEIHSISRGNLKLQFSTSSILKIIKSRKIILEKIMWGNTVAIHTPRCFKEKNYETKFSTSSI